MYIHGHAWLAGWTGVPWRSVGFPGLAGGPVIRSIRSRNKLFSCQINLMVDLSLSRKEAT